jgi:hypothetical protein
MRFEDRMREVDALYPGEVISRWQAYHSRPWYTRLVDAFKNFFDTLRGDIENE